MFEMMSGLKFMLLWCVGSLLSVLAFLAITGITVLLAGIVFSLLTVIGLGPVLFPFALAAFCFIGLMTGLITGMAQQRVIYAKYNIWFHHWRLASALGGLVGLILTAIVLGLPVRHIIQTLALPNGQILALFGALPLLIPLFCISMAQSFVLVRNVYHVWLWVLANVVAGLVAFSMFMAFAVQSGGAMLIVTVNLVPLLFIALAPGIVTGFAMLWLMRFQRRYTL